VIRSDYVDVAVGLAVVFFLTSLVVSGLNEGLAWATRVRSKFLWAYLHDLCDPARAKALPRGLRGVVALARGTTDKRPRTVPTGSLYPTLLETDDDDVPRQAGVGSLLQHLARALDPLDVPELTATRGTDERATAARTTSIQHVPPSSLAQAFFEVFAEVGKERLMTALSDLAKGLQPGESVDPARVEQVLTALVGSDATLTGPVRAAFVDLVAARDATTDDAARAQAQAFATTLQAVPGAKASPELADAAVAFVMTLRGKPLSAVEDAAQELWRPLAGTFPEHFSRQRVEAGIESLDDAPLGPTARRLWEASSRKLDGFRSALESYLDGEMTRVSGYYKRSIRWILAVIAIVVAVTFNIDALTLTRELWRYPGGRADLVAQADTVVASGAGTTSSSPGLERLQQQCTAAHPPDTEDVTVADAAKGFNDVRTCVTEALSVETGLDVVDRAVWLAPDRWYDDWTDTSHLHWLVHPLGIALTVLALVPGAPFWFDLLKRLTGIRRGMVGQA
jgi:hypothetical protein